jgi:hypothetical protein
MVLVVADMLDDGASDVAEQVLQVGRVYPLAEGIVREYVLDSLVHEDVLYALRSDDVFNEAPGLGRIQVLLVHGNERAQRPVVLRIHPQVHVSTVLVGAMPVEPSSSGLGEVSDVQVGSRGIFGLKSIYGVQECSDDFGGGVSAVFIAELVTFKLSGKRDPLHQAPMVGLAKRSSERLG